MMTRARAIGLAIWTVAAAVSAAQQTAAPIPVSPLKFGAFVATFGADRTFRIVGQGWPTVEGTFTISGNEIVLAWRQPPRDCGGAGRYRFRVESGHVSFDLVSDDCAVRRMALDRSTWRVRLHSR